jgi:hypothetical protein
VLTECLLRLIATGATVNGVPIGETYRQYSEGIASSHFRADSSRDTGNAILQNAPTVLILGDSHVPAVQIEDRETMGSVLERRARTGGTPLNVKQFGWSGEGYGIARTLGLGPELVKTVNPLRVIVFLSEGALRTYPANTAEAEQLRREPPPSLRNLNRFQRFARMGAHYSVVAHLLYARSRELLLIHRTKEQADSGATSCVTTEPDERRAVMGALQRTFGSKLIVLYAPELGLDGSAGSDCWETLFFEQSKQSGVAFLSLRQAMLEARKSNVVVRGFHNTRLGFGHLNAAGHELIARVLYEELISSGAINR